MTDGTDVRIRGRLDWYGVRGQLQLRMTTIDPAYTLGQLEVARAALIARLQDEGLLRANAVHPLPIAPLCIGLVTSEGSAAEADFLDELRRSGFAFRVLHAHSLGPGPRCGPLDRLLDPHARHPRSRRPRRRARWRRATDLAAFDDEAVARAIAACAMPVLTGIGHEVDTSVADEVAHTAAKTPTACAQLLVARVAALAGELEGTWSAIATRATRNVAAPRRPARHVGPPPVPRHAGGRRPQHHAPRLDRRSLPPGRASEPRLGHPPARRPSRPHHRCRPLPPARRRGPRRGAGERRVAHRAPRRWPSRSARSTRSRPDCGPSTPTAPWRRGWSITRGPDGQVVRTPADVSAGDALTTVLAGGELRSTVSPDA